MFKSVGERTPLCGTLDLKWHCVSTTCVCFASPDVVSNTLSDGVRYIGVYEIINKCIYIHSTKC